MTSCHLEPYMESHILILPSLKSRVRIPFFFASVEQQANPELMGKRIAVVRGNGRTVITTASYEAREFEVKTGMAIIGSAQGVGNGGE